MTGPSIDLLAGADPLRERARALLSGWASPELEAAQGGFPGYDTAVWAAVTELLGSSAGRPPLPVGVLEELGYAGCPIPLRSRRIQRDAMLGALGPDVAAVPGPGDWVVALPGDLARLPQLTPAGAGGRVLSGAIGDLEYGDSVEGLLVPARLTGDSPDTVLVAVPVDAPGVEVVTHQTLSSNHLTDVTFTDVTFTAVALGDDWLVSSGSAGVVEQAITVTRLVGIIALGAETVGHAAALLATTVDRVTSRSAFGSTLAALPTVQQRVADMYLDFVAARAAIHEAAQELAVHDSTDRIGMPPPDRLVALVSAAKLTCIDGSLRIAAGAHQLCGGWGQLWASGLHHHTRAIKAAEGQLGRPHEHAAIIARLLSASSASAGFRGL